MIKILPLNSKLRRKIKAFNLEKKFNKQLNLFINNPFYPSLKTELLRPKNYGIYSFRIDKKYRAIFIFRDDKKAVEILNITAHYQ
ncbi:MAG: hypothetical protein ACPL1D_02925 [Microgenomates group bacterium]